MILDKSFLHSALRPRAISSKYRQNVKLQLPKLKASGNAYLYKWDPTMKKFRVDLQAAMNRPTDPNN